MQESKTFRHPRQPVGQHLSKESRPTVDLGSCSKCGGCIEVAPEIFRFSESGGFIEIVDLEHYDRDRVQEAMKFCPEDCIHWEED